MNRRVMARKKKAAHSGCIGHTATGRAITPRHCETLRRSATLHLEFAINVRQSFVSGRVAPEGTRSTVLRMAELQFPGAMLASASCGTAPVIFACRDAYRLEMARWEFTFGFVSGGSKGRPHLQIISVVLGELPDKDRSGGGRPYRCFRA